MKQKRVRQRRKVPLGRKEVCPPTAWVVRCPHDASVRGHVDVRFQFVEEWLAPDKGVLVLQALDRHSKSFVCASSTYVVRTVLRHWRALDADGSKLCLRKSSVIAFLSELRKDYFESEFKRGKALSSLGREWSGFVRFLPYLTREGLLPAIDVSDERICKIPESLTSTSKSRALAEPHRAKLAPKSLDIESDSYNETLFEKLSIGASESRYLDEYEVRLSKAIDCVKAAALRDFELLEKKYEARVELADRAISLMTPSDEAGMLSLRPIDFFKLPSEESIGMLLNFVNTKMAGIPRAWVQPLPYKSARPSDVSVIDCRKLVAYGKNSLLPYLGVMTSEAALVCLTLLICEHPKLNSTTLARARLLWPGGRQLTSTETVDGAQRTRFNATKPRANSEKSVILSPLAERVVNRVLMWTSTVRDSLTASGKREEANRLWIGISLSNYELLAFSHSALTSGFRREGRELAESRERDRLMSFIEIHPELQKWAKKLNLKNLRVNVGVLDFIRSGGDLTRAAETFGHGDIQTTLDDYIPAALKHAI
jgi:hypothetical protein